MYIYIIYKSIYGCYIVLQSTASFLQSILSRRERLKTSFNSSKAVNKPVA